METQLPRPSFVLPRDAPVTSGPATTSESARVPPAELPSQLPPTDFLHEWLEDEVHPEHGNVCVLVERNNARSAAQPYLCEAVRDHFVGTDVLARMGFAKSAAFLRSRLPSGKRIRSGDLAEILATEYIERRTEFTVPLKRLRHKDDREMSMRGDDVIGVHRSDGRPVVLKAEVKSRAALTGAVVGEACKALNAHRGRPKPATLGFITAQLRLMNLDSEAERLENLMTVRVGARDITHFIFTLSGNAPLGPLAAHSAGRRLVADRRLVGLRIGDHQEFIRETFEAVEALYTADVTNP